MNMMMMIAHHCCNAAGKQLFNLCLPEKVDVKMMMMYYIVIAFEFN